MEGIKVLGDALLGIGAFFVIVPILVAVHELGHFWSARAFGMHVNAFAIMMGGIRSTRLEPRLDKPIGPTAPVLALGALGAALALVGPFTRIAEVGFAALAILGIVVPSWVSFRLERLYHLPPWTAARMLGIALGVGSALLLVPRGFKLPDPYVWLGVASGSSWIATLLLYYRPVLGKSEDTPQGHGRITLRDGTDEDVIFRPIWARSDRHGTEYSLLALPLGGFAAIRGMAPKEDGAETQVEGGFYSRPAWQRFIVLFAGPFFSVAFGVLLLAGVVMGYGKTVASNEPVIGAVVSGGPAASAGLKVGDRLIGVNGTPVSSFFEFVVKVRSSKTTGADGAIVAIPVRVEYERAGARTTVEILPEIDAQPTPVMLASMEPSRETAIQAKVKAGPGIENQPTGIGEAFGMAVVQPVEMAVGLSRIVMKPQRATEELGGPATMAQQTAEASKLGIRGLLGFAALLSISFGVLNLLPIAPLDGGQMMIALVEIFRRNRRLSFKTQSFVVNVSVVILGLLMLTVITADIQRLAKTPTPSVGDPAK